MGDETKEPRTIGAMNGAWAVLLRLTLATYPLVVAWCVWITAQQFEDKAFRDAGPRFTAVDAELQVAALRQEMMTIIATLPPADWRERIRKIETIANENSVKLTKVLTLLEGRHD